VAGAACSRQRLACCFLADHLGDNSKVLWPSARGFDETRGFHFSGPRWPDGLYNWEHGSGGIRHDPGDGCGSTGRWYDLIWDDTFPDPAVSPADASSTWVGSDWIREGNTATSARSVEGDINNAWATYKARAAGGSRPDVMDQYETAFSPLNGILKVLKEETVKTIMESTADEPFFIYAATPAMRDQGVASDAEYANTYEKIGHLIEACDWYDPDATTYAAGTSMDAMRTLVYENNDCAAGTTPTQTCIDAWTAAYAYVETAMCNDVQKNKRFVTHAFASSVDNLLKVTVDALHSKGIWENTIVIFSSDNGMPDSELKAETFNSNTHTHH